MTNPATAEMPEKMPLTSMDIAEEKREELRQAMAHAFPEVFAEGPIDFDQLKRVLGEWVEPDRERFGLNWPGKAACMKVIQAPSVGTLKPCPEESVDWDTTQNLFIEGDNLEVLKLLQKAYFGKVKMIYIDPPYNTGKEFIYPDKYAETLETYLEYTGQKDSEGRTFSTNTDTSGRFHSRWLNMMYPRLYLAKNLLREDGVVFISIDDNEQPSLRALCDQIFGGENFVANFIWEKRTNRENRKIVSLRHDYILCYCKNSEKLADAISQLPMSEEALARYKNPDNDPRGPWKSDPATAQAGHGTRSQFYVLTAPNGKEHHLESGRCWLYTKEVMEEAIKDGRIWLGRDGNGVPRVKTYLNDKERGLTPESVWFASEVSTNEAAKTYLKALFDGKAVFDTPKPVSLVEQAIKIGAQEGIVLDFFAGSAVTAEAVFRSSADISFILVQLPEPCEPNSEAHKAGYETIADVAKERIRRAAKNTSEMHLDNQRDLGFRAYKLDSSCFKQWQGDISGLSEDQLVLRLKDHAQHIDGKAGAEDILYEVLLKDGFELTVPIQKLTLAGKEVSSVEGNQLLICLEKELTQELMDEMAALDPSRVIVLDAGFQNNDQLKANAVQTFKARARDKETAIVFRTV